MVYEMIINQNVINPDDGVKYAGVTSDYSPYDKRFVHIMNEKNIGIRSVPVGEKYHVTVTDEQGREGFDYYDCQDLRLLNTLMLLIGKTLEINKTRQKVIEEYYN